MFATTCNLGIHGKENHKFLLTSGRFANSELILFLKCLISQLQVLCSFIFESLQTYSRLHLQVFVTTSVFPFWGALVSCRNSLLLDTAIVQAMALYLNTGLWQMEAKVSELKVLHTF